MLVFTTFLLAPFQLLIKNSTCVNESKKEACLAGLVGLVSCFR